MEWRRMLGKRRKKGSAMAEAAITLPVVILISFAMVNLSMAWYAAVAASSAANYGARVGSVAQTNPASYAAAAAQAQLSTTGVGTYTVTASGGGYRGAQIVVSVDYLVPNYIVGLLSFFGGSGNETGYTGTAVSTFRQEGW